MRVETRSLVLGGWQRWRVERRRKQARTSPSSATQLLSICARENAHLKRHKRICASLDVPLNGRGDHAAQHERLKSKFLAVVAACANKLSTSREGN